MGSRVRSPLADGESMLVERIPRPVLRDSFYYRRGLKRAPLKRESKSHKAELAKYRKLAAVFLAQPENSWCICCTVRREHGENIVRNPAVEIHHFAGRIGRLLCYVPYFRAFCNACRTWPHEHPSLARELNLLVPASLWNCFPASPEK